MWGNLISISAMEAASQDRTMWKWPTKPDIMEYITDDIEKKISQPVPCGSRRRATTFSFPSETF
jgi:hypothetical protein